MKHYIICLTILVFLLAGCSAAPKNGADEPWIREILNNYPELNGKPYTVEEVKRVVDGDTIETVSGHKVRLIGVDTPEVFGGAEYFGREASEFSKKRLGGQTVVLFKDVSETDKYKRLLRYVFIKNDSVMFNETLVAEGYANPVTFPPDVMFAEKFVDLEREARNNHRGLWQKSGEAPMAEVRPAAASSCENPTIKGNINSRNDKIYHVPGGRSYEQTKAEVMFCTEEEAEVAGFRKPKQ